MNKLKRLKLLLSLISCAFLTNCAVKPPNIYVYENLQQRLSTDPITGHLMLTPSPTCMKQIGEAECGHGVSIVSGKEIFVGEDPKNQPGGKPWSQLKAESVYVPAVESYAPLATYIINSCKKNNCDSTVTGFKINLDKVVATSPPSQ